MALRLWVVGIGVTAIVLGVLVLRATLSASQTMQATIAGF